ncbi:pyridoxamine 5'-phosphate oxidase family protein [Aeromicrobium sp. A1-2]|uniref:pyridoxamine 5'-phosphate oxidase family protein n=1 Tax=Aeromicrobium sp. A1-2 TaxID=2107713 RepID=UPI001C1FA3E6|nr:pyridoxamine 5'-phosphate oxidase family protein [Aeromicrobium sp. A1-2]
MTTSDDQPRATLVPIDEEQCRQLLTTTTVGRVAFVNDEGQQLIPVNFAYLDGAVYFRTEPGRVLSALARGHDDVAFGVDHHDVFRQGWNVTVRGPAAEVEDRATINKVLGHSRLRPWAGGVRPLVIRITADSIAGRRVSGNTA